MDLEHSRKRSKDTIDKAKQVDELQSALQKEQAESARLREVAKQVGMGSCLADACSKACNIFTFFRVYTNVLVQPFWLLQLQ